MKINLDLLWLMQKIRILFILALFYVLYQYVDPVWAFILVFWFILNDLSDIELDVDEIKESKRQIKNELFQLKRKSF